MTGLVLAVVLLRLLPTSVRTVLLGAATPAETYFATLQYARYIDLTHTAGPGIPLWSPQKRPHREGRRWEPHRTENGRHPRQVDSDFLRVLVAVAAP